MKLHNNVTNPAAPRALEPSAPGANSSSSSSSSSLTHASSFSAASALKYACTYGLLALGGAAARGLTEGVDVPGHRAPVRVPVGQSHVPPAVPCVPALAPAMPPSPNATTPAPAQAPAGDSAPSVPSVPSTTAATAAARAAVNAGGQEVVNEPLAVSTFIVPAYLSGTNFEVVDARGQGKAFGLTSNLTRSADQVFDVHGDGAIKLSLNNTCMDVKGASFKSGTPVVAWPCNGQANQKWADTLVAGTADTYVIKPLDHATLCLDVAHAAKGDDASLQVFTCHGGKNQQFAFIAAG